LKNSKASSNAWFPVVEDSYFPAFFRECYRVLKRPGHIYIMCDDEMSFTLRPMLEDAGFEYRKKIIWHKVGAEEDVPCPHCGTHVTTRTRPGMPGMGYPFRSCYEVVLLAQKGKRKVPEDKSVRDVLKHYYEGDPEWQDFEFYEDFVDNLPDVWEGPRLKGSDVYPTEKPIPLYETLIKQSSNPGDLVVDPFAGSGNGLLAARNLGRDFLGFDITDAALAWFDARLKGLPTPTLTGDGVAEKRDSIFDVM
jgi:site-specific DNA-methyltransferase (adenine-specific)